MFSLKKFLVLIILYPTLLFAEHTSSNAYNNMNILEKKIDHERSQDFNPFSLLAYEQNYLLPLNYTTSPLSAYNSNNPDHQKIRHVDFKFQLSFKSPVTHDLFNKENTLYLAYTQQSYWQSYSKSAFFRANNYQPEIFIENNLNIPLGRGWALQLLNVGFAHQSNGRGGILERTWNRCYAETSFSKERWLVSVRGWMVVSEASMKSHNPDIRKFLGHGRLLVAHNFDSQVISLMTYNNIESRFKRGSTQLSYSFPIGQKIRGYLQFFNGFGQNLIEYNHRTSAYGVGISLSDWL
jgi:phospholipase A1